MKLFVLIAGTFLLLSAVCLRGYFALVPPPEPTHNGYLSDILPQSLPEWSVVDHDMAESPESSARISEFLNFDDALFRTYSNGRIHVGVYVAYWSPGKASYRWAGAHTPDTCWVQNGWACNERQYSIPFSNKNVAFELAEFGVYEKEGKTQQVYFWHLVGGHAYSYKQNEGHNIFAALIDIKSHGLNLRKEQFFIRLSSNADIVTLKKMPAFGTILESLASLGLTKKMQASSTLL